MTGRVTAVKGRTASVDFGGVTVPARIDLLPDITEGEHVLVHAGFVIQRIRADDVWSTPAGREPEAGVNSDLIK
jgi:hydrogenase maturation factor